MNQAQKENTIAILRKRYPSYRSMSDSQIIEMLSSDENMKGVEKIFIPKAEYEPYFDVSWNNDGYAFLPIKNGKGHFILRDQNGNIFLHIIGKRWSDRYGYSLNAVSLRRIIIERFMAIVSGNIVDNYEDSVLRQKSYKYRPCVVSISDFQKFNTLLLSHEYYSRHYYNEHEYTGDLDNKEHRTPYTLYQCTSKPDAMIAIPFGMKASDYEHIDRPLWAVLGLYDRVRWFKILDTENGFIAKHTDYATGEKKKWEFRAIFNHKIWVL